MRIGKWLIVPACCALVSLSTLARAETYHFGEDKSSMPAGQSGAHAKHTAKHTKTKHPSPHRHASEKSSDSRS